MSPEIPNGLLRYKVAELEARVNRQDELIEKIGDKIDRLFLAAVAAAFSFALSVGIFAITIFTTRGR